jgi:hypothetical protein
VRQQSPSQRTIDTNMGLPGSTCRSNLPTTPCLSREAFNLGLNGVPLSSIRWLQRRRQRVQPLPLLPGLPQQRRGLSRLDCLHQSVSPAGRQQPVLSIIPSVSFIERGLHTPFQALPVTFAELAFEDLALKIFR